MAVVRLVWGALAVGSVAAGLPSGYPSTVIKGVSGEVDMPLFGIGTWQYNSSRAQAAVELAFGMGYRHVDTANDYDNQVGVGKALRNTGLARKDFFVTTKIPGGLNASASRAALDQNLQDLGLDYVDLMLLHFPGPSESKATPGAVMRRGQWVALQEWALAGKARAVGVSHYCRHHIEDILSVSKVPIAVNQVQYHVGMGAAPDTATDDKAYMLQRGILYQSFSPFCGPCGKPHSTELLTGPLVTGIGQKYNKSGAQVSLKWLVQQGIPVIPKSDRAEHLKENMDLFGWTLSDDDMQVLTSATSPPVGGGPSDTDSGDCSITQFVL